MRTLRFIVDGQTISLDPDCDFSSIVPGTRGYLQAEFSFSSEWDGCAKAVAFFSNLGREFEPQLLPRNNICTIPEDALERSIFKVQVIGQSKTRSLRTNKVKVYQKGG